MNFVKGHKTSIKILIFATFGYIITLFLLSLWKYLTNKYNGLDLAIYNQVFWNLSRGNGSYSSIQAGNYFGDHAEFFILLLLPFYKLFPHPLTLLTLQTIALASTAFPIFLIAKKFIDQKFSLLISLLWFINPILWNINFFEFHLLPFSIPLLLFAIYYALENRPTPYLIFILLSLSVREDVALTATMLGFTIMSKNKKLGLVTIIISILWFLGSMKLIRYFSVDGNYKYLTYYGWLGDSLKEIVATVFQNPIAIMRHIWTLQNFEMILGFSMAFLFLPIITPLFLALAIPPLLQFLFSAGGGGALIFQTHYASLFLPALVVAFIFGVHKILKKFDKFHKLITLLLISGSVYNLFPLGPLIPAIQAMKHDIRNREWQDINELFTTIPKSASVGTTFMPLTKLSSRKDLHALHYLYIGKKQLSSADFVITETPEYLVIDENELKTSKAQYDTLAWSSKFTHDGWKRLQNLIDNGEYGLMTREKTLVLLKKDSIKIYEPYTLPDVPKILRGYTTLNGIRSIETKIIEN